VVVVETVHIEHAVRQRSRRQVIARTGIPDRHRLTHGRRAGRHSLSVDTGAVSRPDRDCRSGRFGDARSLLRTPRHIGNAIAHGQPPMAPTLA
jgi:hypothetical protein